MRKWWAIAVLAALSISACAPTIEAEPGIVSTSLCGDTYVLAGEVEIAALSWQSDGPLSRAPGNYRKASSDPETLVAMQPEILVLGPSEHVRDAMLPNTQIVSLDWVEDWDGVLKNVYKIPGLDPGPAEVATQVRNSDNQKSVLYLSRSGGTAGPGTYVDAAIQMAGGENIVTTPGWFTPDPEWIIAQKPDVILTSFFDAYESVNATGLRNAAIAEFITQHQRVDIPGALWPCAGPGLAEAAALIREGVE